MKKRTSKKFLAIKNTFPKNLGKDYKFEEEINQGKISVVTYTDKKGELKPMYILTIPQAK